MVADRSQDSFAEAFERVLNETDTSIRRLSRLSGIPRRTLENWLYGRTVQPRYVEPILKVARALNLPAGDADKLLLAAGHPTIADLKESEQPLSTDLLLDWQVAPNILIGQRSAALPAQHNLPAATTPFIGREADSVELAALLRRPDIRLVTVSGMGGAGKTRLALETARSLLGRFDHGIYFISLDNVNSSKGFWEAILHGLHIPSDGANPVQQIVEDYLKNKQILLLLDNFEHLLPVTAEISHLLTKTQRLKLLITSRQALDLQAEQLYPIGGLAYQEGQDSPAYQLFVQTARRRVPGYKPSPPETEDIVALCTQVEGLPLAIELTATWSDILSPAQILEHLQRNLNDVWHKATDRPERQKSLWDLFDYSWQMLPNPEQEAALQLSVLRGSFTPAMAMAIAGCEATVLKLLLQTSVVGRTSDSRLMMHPLVRQFLQQQAVRAGHNIEALEERFMEFTLVWAAEQSSQLRQTFDARYFQNLHAEWQHFERAWWLAVERRSYELLESCWDILFYFEARGNWGQGNAFFEATRRQIPVANRRMHALLDEAQSVMAARHYEIPRSMKLAQRSLQTLDELGVDSEQDMAGAYARVVLSTSDYTLNQMAFSEEKKQELIELSGGYLSKFARIAIDVIDGTNHCSRSEFADASLFFQNALDICGYDGYSIPALRCYLGISLLGQGLETAAREQFVLALQRAVEIESYVAMVSATYAMQLVEEDEATMQKRREALDTLALEMGSRRTVGRVAIMNAISYLNLGFFKQATQLMRIGVGMVWNEVDKAERARILSTIAQAYIAFGLIKTAPQVLSLVTPKGANY